MADPIESLGPFPIIQIAVGAAIAIGIAVTVWRAVAGRPKLQETAGPGVQWFLDGPIGKIIDLLQGIYRELRQTREDNQRYANERNGRFDEAIELLREVKDRSGTPRRH